MLKALRRPYGKFNTEPFVLIESHFELEGYTSLRTTSPSFWKIQGLITGERYVSYVTSHAYYSQPVPQQIPQLYVNFPSSSGEPPSVLKGFTHVELSPKDTAQVNITLSRYDLSIWNVVDQGWQRPNGTIQVTVGASSRDNRLSGIVSV